MDLAAVNNNIKILVGGAVLASIVWFFKWLIQRVLTDQFNRMNQINLKDKEEREYDQYLALRGQQVTNDCLHELIYAVLNGTHNGGLQRANEELEKYRQITDENLSKKAARWNIKIQK